MTIRAELADGRVLEFPDGTDPSVIQTTVKRMISESPVQTGGAPQEGITAALTGGFKRFLSTGETALESLINPELSALRGAERSKQIGEQYAPGASLEKVKQAYESQGLFPAIKEGISQIPAALAEQAPQIAATLGSARLGAMAGSPFGPLGAVVGGVSGAVAPSLIQLYGSNLERQAEEKVPEISRASAFGAAVPGAALEVASQFIPLGRGLVGKLLGPKADEFLKKGSQEAIEKAAQESMTTTLTKGAGIGVLAEMPTEVAQQMLERFQAGLPLTDEEALKEYGEAAYGAGLVGGPFGAGARALGRPGARAEYQRQQQEEEARLAVTDEELAQRFPDVLPGGLRIEEQELSREMAPAGYSILAEGREEPLSVVDTAEEAQTKLESLTQIREQERAKLLEEDQKIDAGVQEAQARLEQLEATEQSGTEEYQTLKADLPRMMEESAQKKAELYDRIEKLGAPLTVTPFGEVERVNKQFNVVGPDAAPVGSFKTLGEAEAAVKEIVGEDRFTQEQQNRETAKQLYKTFVPQMRKFGLGDVGLNIVDRIENGAGGSYLNKLIKVSLEDTKPIQTMRHESLHAMKDLGFFTPQQWKALEERANKEWIKKYLEGQETEIDGQRMSRLEGYRKLGYSEQDIIEEAIADAFGDYDKGAKPPPGLITALYRKVKNFFSNLGQALRGAGFQSAEDIFQGIEKGKLKPAAEAKPVAEERLSLAPKGIPQKIWDLHEKAQQADEEAAGRVAAGKAPGALKRNQTMSFRRLNEAVMDFVGGDEKKAEDLMVQMNQESSRREEKLSLKRAAVEGEVEISTQNPTGPKRAYDPIAQMLSIDEKAVMEAMKSNPDYRKATIKALKSYGFIPEGVKDKDVIELFKNNIVDNLLYLYNLVPESIRKRSKLWYDGANKISEQMAEKYGLSLRQVSAIMAAMSPQKDWFQNVSMGERAIDILTKHGDRSWTPEMLQYAESYVKETKDRAEREKRQEDFDKIKKVAAKGTTLNEMDVKSAAAFIRAYDEAFHSRQYRIVTPEGGFGEIVTNNDGTPSTMMWSTYGPIEKAVSIFRDGSRENVSQQLGFEHKIRSFYNNIAAPNSDLEHVTIDTHAVAAALFEALAGTDPEVVQNFGGTGKTSITGVGGTYGLIADAYREAARKVGVLPREMQSITWEAVRGLFNEDIKSSIKEPVKAEWAKYKSGDQSFEQARQNIIEISRNKRTNDKGVDIPPPDWVGSGKGEFVEDGGESYDKSYVPTGGVRLREEKEIRDKLTFNLSAVTGSIPGLRELYDRALKRDEKAGTVLQEVADASLTHLLSGTNAKVAVTRAKGVYLSDREPSLMVAASFNESEGKDVLAALARFAKNFNQEQIHVRMPTKKKVGFEYGDGSYTTNVFTIPLKKELNDKAISDIIDKSGLKGFTVTNDSLITYFVRPNKDQGESNEQYAKRIDQEFKVFEEQVASAHVLAGRPGTKVGRKIERLFVYGTGYGAAIDYESILGDVRPKQGADTVTPRLIAEYLTGKPVQVFKQKDLTKAQVAQQEKLARTFDSLPVNDLKNPTVKKAYRALTKALKEQFAVLPIKVELQTEKDADGNIVPPYNNNSAAMRKDILERNHMLVYPTTPETFGPEGYDFSGHPLLEDSGFKDINGEPMLFNDVLRAVHDYFAHGMSEAQFGPKGEFTAWRNHMASTPDPMARWALTAETRMQNAWQNFSEGAQKVPLKDRPFALQKAALPPTEFLYTGDNSVDLSVYQMEQELSDKQKRGSEPTAKFSLARPTSPAFKEWFGDSKIVNEDGSPMVMYHGLAKDTKDFTRKTARGAPIFLTDDTDFAARFAADSYLQVADHPEKYLTKEQLADGEKRAISAIRKDYGKDSLGKEMIESIKDGSPTAEAREYLQKEYVNMLPAGPHIMPLYVRAEKPFDYDNASNVRSVVNWLKDKVGLSYIVVDKGFVRINDLAKVLREGDWHTIESEDIQSAIKELGFDSFYVKEHGRKNIAVYEANQVKSATGNVGTYDLKNPDVRYSLRGVAFPTVEEAKEAADKEPVPDTPEFKRFIAGSQWLDENGKAKKFFHATPFDFFDFKDGVIYLSETAEESEPWGRMAEDRLRESAYKALNKDEKIPFFQQAVDQAVSKGKITEAEGKEFMRDVKRKVPDFGDYKAIKKEMDDVLFSLFPNRMKIMPVYARAMAPFDFRNKEHVNQVVNYITSRVEIDRKVSDQVKEINKLIGGAPTTNTENILNGLSGNLSQGYASFIEKPEVQRAIRRLFDGYNMRRNRAAPISYAVFKPKDLKSITGNDGQFSLETKDIRYSLSRAAYTPERIDRLIGQFAYTQSDAENDTKAYIARVSPRDFLRATATYSGLARIRSEAELLDVGRLTKESQPIYLSVREGKVGNTDVWEITGHEGRHRMMALADAGYDSVPVVFDFGSRVSNAKPVDMKYVVRQNFGGEIGKAISDFTVSDAIPVSYGQEKALRGFEETKGIKFSLPTLSAATQNRLNEVTPQRYEPTFKDRVIGAFKQDFTSLRQKFLNRYEALAVLDRRLREQMRQSGGPALLADQSAEFAALQSDLAAGVTASAMGIGDRQGGVPVYRNGFTTIDTSVKGLTEALAPLAKYGDPEIYQRYQFWAGWKRGRRLLREGREQVYTPADAKLAQEIEAKHPEFVQVQKDLVAFNNGIVNFAVQTGVLSRERAQVYTKYADYIPFYRQLDLDKTIGPNPFSGISGLRGPKELKGGEAPLGDFMENLVRNTQSMINAGMKNAAAQKATKVALQLENVMVERLPGPAKGVGYDVYTVLENGELVYYRSADPLFIDALKSLNMPDLPFMGLLSAPANVLRNLVTKDPGFMMANLLRDSLSSYVTSGQNVTPIVGTMVNFGKALAGKDKNLQALFNAGVIGGYEFSQNVEQSGKSLSADLNKKAGKDAILLRPFKSLWEGLEKGTTASDAATRMAVYERVMAETGNEAEAISRALEVMNFNRKGNSILIRIATAALPFFNARLQGLDLFYRASTGRMDTQDAQEIKRKFWVRGMTMASLSVMYYMSVAGDDEYEKQEEETKDNNWIFPSLGIRVPIPFEVGTLFKTMPERITAYLMGNDTGKELSESTIRALANTFAFNPIPQTFKPIIEVATNYNFFTMRPIVGQGMQDVEPKFQVGPGTSKTAEYLGGLLNVSPLKLDQLIKGYTGTIGGYVTDVVDAMASEFSDVPKASNRFEQMPIIKRFALDPEARGSVTQFYELQKSVDTFVRTANLLEKTARPEEYAKYVQENLDMLAAKDYISGVEKGMKELREMKRLINTLDIPPDEKRDLLVDLGRAENNLTANTKTIKKAFSELK
jgi:hypothetical protein